MRTITQEEYKGLKDNNYVSIIDDQEHGLFLEDGGTVLSPFKVKKELSTVAKAAKLIRAELKETFPTIKFRVKSQNYTGGDSVNVHWNMGPTTDEVKKITNKYQYGHFNGMEDIYEFSNSIEGLPQTKYLFTNRHMKSDKEEKMDHNDFNKLYENEETMQHKMMKDFCKLHNNIEYKGHYTKVWENSNETVSQVIYRIFNKSPLMTGYHGMEETGESCGTIESMYRMK